MVWQTSSLCPEPGQLGRLTPSPMDCKVDLCNPTLRKRTAIPMFTELEPSLTSTVDTRPSLPGFTCPPCVPQQIHSAYHVSCSPHSLPLSLAPASFLNLPGRLLDLMNSHSNLLPQKTAHTPTLFGWDVFLSTLSNSFNTVSV